MEQQQPSEANCHACHPADGKRPDYLLWGSFLGIAILYALWLFASQYIIRVDWLHRLATSVFELINTIWWGIALGILMLVKDTTKSWKIA